jgi:hypothetical protein
MKGTSMISSQRIRATIPPLEPKWDLKGKVASIANDFIADEESVFVFGIIKPTFNQFLYPDGCAALDPVFYITIAKGKSIVAAVDSQALISIVVAAFLSNKVVEVTLNKRINCSGTLENAAIRVKTLQISLPVQKDGLLETPHRMSKS